ncbi:sigma-54-dependent Fis family transcriptional regulator [Desulfatiferula olefinivorans]
MISLPTPQVSRLLTSAVDFTRMFSDIPVGLAVLDRDHRIVFVNQAFEALTGFSLAQAYGYPCRCIMRSRLCVQNCPARSSKKQHRSHTVESDIVNRDRQNLPVRLTIAPIHDPDGNHLGYVETLEDLRMIKQLHVRKSQAYSFSDIVGRSPQMERVFQTLPVLAQSDASILITGETGTGKDLVAEAIHQTSGRAAGPFIKINCGALPETLLESEIFGHNKGAFTGAVENKPGRFRLAHNGTIFLTEIGDLPLSLQVKLLTFLDDKVIYPLGSTTGFKANVRIIAATHRDLEQMVRDKRFRQDLLFRLNVARIHLPPLRKREGDIRLLLDHFLNGFAAQIDKAVQGFTPRALECLTAYRYPGNIRELRNIVEYAANITSDVRIDLEHLPAYLLDAAPLPVPADEPSPEDTGLPDAQPAPVSETTPRTWALAERDMIMAALIRAKGKKHQAADILGWGRSTLWRKMKLYGLDQ